MTHTSRLTSQQVTDRIEAIAKLAEGLLIECQRLDREVSELRGFYDNDDAAVATALGLDQSIWDDAWDFTRLFGRQYPDFVNNVDVPARNRLDDITRWTP